MADETASADVLDNDDTDVELEDIEVSAEELEGESDDDLEALADEPDEDDTTTDDESDVDEATDESLDDTEAPETDEPAVEETDAQKQKQFNKAQAERRLQEKQARIATQREQQQAYVAEAEDDKDLALRQLQVDAYDNKVEANTNKLTNGYERALKDFDILRDASPEIQAELNSALDSFQAMYVNVDVYGNPTDVRGDLYDFLQIKADSIAKLTGIGARKQADAKGKEKSKTLTAPSRAPKEPKVDPMLAAFDEEAYR